MFPKLFRRCTSFLKTVYNAESGPNLSDWLAHDRPGEEDALMIESGAIGKSSNQRLHLHDLLFQDGSKLSMKADVTEMVFIEK